MASWGAMIVLAGFTFDATRGHIGFAPRVQQSGNFRSFWSGANAYGTIELIDGSARLQILGGDLHLSDLGLPLDGGGATATLNGKSVPATSRADGLDFAALVLASGDVLELKAPSLSLRALPDLATV